MQGGVTLRPHYTAGCDNRLNAEEVNTSSNADHALPLIEETRALTITGQVTGVEIIDMSINQRTTFESITAKRGCCVDTGIGVSSPL